jgi:hypothetical protein
MQAGKKIRMSLKRGGYEKLVRIQCGIPLEKHTT